MENKTRVKLITKTKLFKPEAVQLAKYVGKRLVEHKENINNEKSKTAKPE